MATGAKPDYHNSMEASVSEPMYERLLSILGELYRSERVKPGAFGHRMKVEICNDGPVTIVVDSPPSLDANMRGDEKKDDLTATSSEK